MRHDDLEQVQRLVRIMTTEQLRDYRAAHVADMRDNEARGRADSVAFSQSRIAAIDAELVRRGEGTPADPPVTP